MFDKIIKFSTEKEYLKEESLFPEPCKLNIPEWYKKLEHSADSKTIKGCMPFLDTLTSGYLLKIPTDIFLRHNILENNERGTIMSSGMHDSNININKKDISEIHPVGQVGKKCPFVNKNKSLPFHKILNPWLIKTPPGYSCLFLPPINNTDDRFSIIPGIVDTDTFDMYINFPIIVNGDKYPILETLLKKGTPYVQVIPFKRDSWKLKIGEVDLKKMNNKRYFYNLDLIHNYKNKFWNKKSWK
tara:strand:- start:1335 stop:2063 length:729 start_codon:yes stop_codon:yes gene_type:complete